MRQRWPASAPGGPLQGEEAAPTHSHGATVQHQVECMLLSTFCGALVKAVLELAQPLPAPVEQLRQERRCSPCVPAQTSKEHALHANTQVRQRPFHAAKMGQRKDGFLATLKPEARSCDVKPLTWSPRCSIQLA